MTSNPTELSDEKCTCGNNRWIRSNISGDNLECRRVDLGANMTLARSRWMSNYHITRCDRKSDQLERRCWNENHVPAEAGPPVEQPRRTGKKGCDSQKSLGVNMLQSLFGLQLTSHTQPFRIKWDVYFSKELCPLVVIVSLLFFCLYMCIVGHGYTTYSSIV